MTIIEIIGIVSLALALPALARAIWHDRQLTIKSQKEPEQ